MKGKFSDFLSWHSDESASVTVKSHAERALNLLIRMNAKRFGELFDAYPDMASLHKALRQTDAFDSPHLDMTFWHLFHATRLVWEWETWGYEDFMAMKKIVRKRDHQQNAAQDGGEK